MSDKCPFCGDEVYGNRPFNNGSGWRDYECHTRIHYGADGKDRETSRGTMCHERELCALKSQLADREARLAAVFHETQLACRVNHGTDYPVGWDDAMACIESICKGKTAIDFPAALSLAGWEAVDALYVNEAENGLLIRRKKEADDEVD